MNVGSFGRKSKSGIIVAILAEQGIFFILKF